MRGSGPHAEVYVYLATVCYVTILLYNSDGDGLEESPNASTERWRLEV